MPFEYSEILEAMQKDSRYSMIANFVETGTYHGDTAMMASKHFRHVYTIEVVRSLYELSVGRAKRAQIENIHFYLGDSVEHLKAICPLVSDGAVFYIDAHQSGPDTSFNGKELVPLLSELDVILSHSLGPSIFIFDDVRFWKGESCEDKHWRHISQLTVLEHFLQHGFEILTFYQENDHFFVLTL